MELSLQIRLRGLVSRGTVYQNLMFVFCVLFGLALVVSVQSAGDGTWFWYASFLRGGRLLYADMHLALQPVFVLETSWWMALVGKGWLVSKVPAVVHLLLYCLGLLLLVRRSDWTDGQKAILLGAAFFVSICFEAYRFDDYHVLADCFELFSMVGLLRLQRAEGERFRPGLVATLGALSGLALTTRLNDGAALVLGVALALLCMLRTKRVFSVVVFGLVAAATVGIVVRLTGDSLHDYAMYSIFKAAGSKGGAGSVLRYPLRLPLNTLVWLKHREYEHAIEYACAIAVSWVFLLRPLVKRRGWVDWLKAALGVAIIVVPYHRHFGAFAI